MNEWRKKIKAQVSIFLFFFHTCSSNPPSCPHHIKPVLFYLSPLAILRYSREDSVTKQGREGDGEKWGLKRTKWPLGRRKLSSSYSSETSQESRKTLLVTPSRKRRRKRFSRRWVSLTVCDESHCLRCVCKINMEAARWRQVGSFQHRGQRQGTRRSGIHRYCTLWNLSEKASYQNGLLIGASVECCEML